MFRYLHRNRHFLYKCSAERSSDELHSYFMICFRFELEGLINLPFTSVSKETLSNLMDQFSSPGISNEIIAETKL